MLEHVACLQITTTTKLGHSVSELLLVLPSLLHRSASFHTSHLRGRIGRDRLAADAPLLTDFPAAPHSPSPAEQQQPAAALHGSLPPLLFQKINRQQQSPTLREATDPDRASATAADAARRRRDLPCQICTEEEILISTSRFVFFSFFFPAPSNSSLLGVAVAVTLPSHSLSLSPPPDA